MRILLVNTNRMKPPIAPLALDYLAATLRHHGHEVELLDLCWEDDPLAAVDRQLGEGSYGLVGLTFRNTDDCYYPGRGWFVPELTEVYRHVRAGTAAPVVLGGVGFSIMPGAILDAVGADLGVQGDGEAPLLALASGASSAPGLLQRKERRSATKGSGVFSAAEKTPDPFVADPLSWQPPVPVDLTTLPPMPRDFVDNERYLRLGGQLGFETKRGCAAHCIYCAEPIARGRQNRLRPPESVAEELAALARRELVHLHTCDSEFNRPPDHALAVCEAISERGLGDRLRWFAYCAPTPFAAELAAAMRRAGCAGVNFGGDSGDAGQLRRLGRDFTPDDLVAAVHCCQAEGMTVMVDLLLGGPGETPETLRHTIDLAKGCGAERIGLSVGVRVYPGTPLATLARRQPETLHGPGAAGDLLAPTFYLPPELGEGLFPLVAELVGDDRRFFFSDPTDVDRNYNYSGNDILAEAIAVGYRGAYWDILRRRQEGLAPLA